MMPSNVAGARRLRRVYRVLPAIGPVRPGGRVPSSLEVRRAALVFAAASVLEVAAGPLEVVQRLCPFVALHVVALKPVCPL